MNKHQSTNAAETRQWGSGGGEATYEDPPDMWATNKTKNKKKNIHTETATHRQGTSDTTGQLVVGIAVGGG